MPNKYKVKQLITCKAVAGGADTLLSLDELGVVRKLDSLTSKWIPMNELPSSTPIEESEPELLEENSEKIVLMARSDRSYHAELISKQNKAINSLTKRVAELENKK